MLNVLYSLHECFEKVNSFVFVAGLKEVSDVFDNNEPNHAIEMILKDLEFNYYVPTDYGETFRHFRRDHMDVLTKRTTLIIMGDARTNYLHPEDRILGEMREALPEGHLAQPGACWQLEHRGLRDVCLQAALPRAQAVPQPQSAHRVH